MPNTPIDRDHILATLKAFLDVETDENVTVVLINLGAEIFDVSPDELLAEMAARNS